MNNIKKHPFTVSASLVAIAIAALFNWPWWGILLALFVGFIIGAIIDILGEE